MREDLDFLYQKAMRSKDVDFMNEVWRLVIDAGLDVELESENLTYRICMIEGLLPEYSRFEFLVGDSQMGENWYRNK